MSSDLRSRLDLLEAQQRLNAAADEALELALRDREPLQAVIDRLLPLLVSHARAQGAWIRTYDEDLAQRDFTFGSFEVEPTAVMKELQKSKRVQTTAGDALVVAQPLDVAGEPFGGAALFFEQPLPPARTRMAEELLHTWCEELDNYLASIARSRRKAQVTRELSAALQAPVLDVGVDRAIEVLRRTVPFEQLLLVYRHEDEPDAEALTLRLFGATDEREAQLREHGPKLLNGNHPELLHELGFDGGREELLIEGIRTQQVVGRFIVQNESDVFNTYDRDLLELFADFLRQRIVDFNRQWRNLSHVFSREVVRRLLNEEHYQRRLKPVVHKSAILFSDISGFTRLSEQVLRKPALVGKLIDQWGAAVVEIIWETGGVFDKMVGDCVIAFWGPPYFEESAQECCQRALTAAQRIREYTQSLNDGKVIHELAGMDPPIGVATGLHFGTVCVGTFGPDEDYTAFSSDMNNTARLQGLATRDEILCMEEFVAVVGEGQFQEPRSAPVKNVAEPLRFRAAK